MPAVATDPSIEDRSFECVGGLECILNIIRALRMGSCLSSESRSPLPGTPLSPLGVRRKKSSLKKGSRNSSFNYRTDELLHRVPGRMFLNGSTEVASLFTQQGKKGINQDAMIVWENFGSRTDTIFCGVFDGHGPYGHLVAKRVRDSLPLRLSEHWEVNIKSNDVLRENNLNPMGSMNSESTPFISADEESRVSIDVEATGKDPEFFQTLKESLLKAFKVMDRELKKFANIDCFCSGTTAVTLVKQGNDLVIGNLGDSRAILGTRNEDGSLTAVQLTVDLKPNLPAEAERIRKYKGRVFALKEEPDVARVWLPNYDSPGLAMARAFGDFCLKSFGLISEPEISYRRLTEKDEFVVLATDGIWDVLSNEQVVEIVASAQTRPSAARELVQSAVCEWRTKYPTSKVDDCAVICLFLDSDSNNLSTASTPRSRENEMSEAMNNEGDPQFPQAGLGISDAVRSGEEDTADGESNVEALGEGKEERSTEVGENGSALDAVSRVDTLLNVPRFAPGAKEESS